jgi:hypothetical protein
MLSVINTTSRLEIEKEHVKPEGGARDGLRSADCNAILTSFIASEDLLRLNRREEVRLSEELVY